MAAERCGQPEKPDYFLFGKADNFDLNDYIRAIRFDELKVPTVPFPASYDQDMLWAGELPSGHAGFSQGHGAFPGRVSRYLSAAICQLRNWRRIWNSPKNGCSDWRQSSKRGLRLDMVHDLNRPFGEMMLGLESWIPLYMTGQIMPWYLPGRQKRRLRASAVLFRRGGG